MTRNLLTVTILTVLLSLAATASADSDLPPPANIRLTYVENWLNNEEQVWICPTDSNVIIANWRDFRLGYRQIGVGRSVDGGLSWVDSLINKPWMQVFGYDSQQSDPTMNADRLGNFVMSALDWDAFGFTGLNTIAFYRSTDKGVSWSGPVNGVWSNSNVTFEDKQFVAIDRTNGIYDGNVYCVWARFYDGPNRLQFIRSIDNVQSFEDTIIVGPSQYPSGCGARDAGQFAFPLVNSNGDVHVFWQGFAYDSSGNCTGRVAIKQAISTDGGQSFTYPDTVLSVSGYQYANGGINTYSAPAADADISGGPFDGNIYISFTNQGPEDIGRTDIDFVRSTDNGATWSERIQINDADDSEMIDAFHPWLIVNQEGVIMVIFYDQRYDDPGYYLFDCIAAYSFDGGLTFTSNHRISTVSSDPGSLKSDQLDLPIKVTDDGALQPLALQPRAGLIGEYIGVTAFHDKINAVWTDSRDGNSEVYTANWYLPLLEPRLAAPPTGSYLQAAPTFAWSTSWKHDQDRYRLEISTDESFVENVVTRTIDTNIYSFDSTLGEGNFYWRVKALKTTSSDSSEFSAVWSFTVDNTPPDTPELSEPADGEVTLNATPFFDWSTSVKAAPVTYTMTISTDPAFTPGPNTVVYSGLTVSELALPAPLTADVLHYWKVDAVDAAANSSTSEVRTVTYSSQMCGDIDGDGEPLITIADLVYLVDYMFNDGPPPLVEAAADVDGSGGGINIADLVYLVDYMFNDGPAPVCR